MKSMSIPPNVLSNATARLSGGRSAPTEAQKAVSKKEARPAGTRAPSRVRDARYWRARAETLRAVAGDMALPETKLRLQRLADACEQRAIKAEQRAAQQDNPA